jgi:pimeloyl-ACP methyl ester carboxylesterase
MDLSGCVIVLAGSDAGNMSYDLPLAAFLTANFQVPVLLFDYRGFGSSQEFPFDPDAIAHPEYL